MTDEAALATAFATVQDAVVAVLEVEPATVRPELTWVDLGADSLALMEVVEIVELAGREQHGDFRITDPEIDFLPSVGALAARLAAG